MWSVDRALGVDSAHWTFLPSLCGCAWALLKALDANPPTFAGALPAADRARNLRQRLLTALFWVPFVPTISIHHPGLMGLFIAEMVWLALGEFVQILAPFRHGVKRPKARDDYRKRTSDRALQAMGLGVALSAWLFEGVYFQTTMLACFFGLVVFHLLSVHFHVEELDITSIHALALHTLAFVLIAFTWSHAILLLRSQRPYCGGLVALMCLASWASDAAGYFIGKRIGRRPIFPRISPGKTWAGTVACLFFAIVPCVGMHYAARAHLLPAHALPRDASTLVYVAFGLLIGVAGVFGGLISSLLKRAGGVKDSGQYFTGHGGVNDRFDTYSLCAPVTYFFAVLLGNWWQAF